jgi:hypothetical protein
MLHGYTSRDVSGFSVVTNMEALVEANRFHGSFACHIFIPKRKLEVSPI